MLRDSIPINEFEAKNVTGLPSYSGFTNRRALVNNVKVCPNKHFQI